MAPTVLIVESDEQSASQLARAFDAAGFVVSRSPDADDAWHRIERSKPSVVVLCAELAGVGGYRLCKKIKSSASTSTIPVFLTSSTATAEVFDMHSKRAYRAEAYFRKPVRPETVAAQAATLIGRAASADDGVQLDDLIVDLDGPAVAVRAEIDTRNVDAVAEIARRSSGESPSRPLSAFTPVSPPASPPASSASRSAPTVTPMSPGAARTVEPVELSPRELALLHDEADDDEGTGEALNEGQTDVRDVSDMLSEAAQAAATRQFRGEVSRLTRRIGELESAHASTLADLASARERARAREEELEVLRSSHQSGVRQAAGASERELLTLREALSAKEREVLDLRDERHAAERAALSLREQVSGLTEQLRERSDELGDVRARLGAVEQSRDEALERARSSESALAASQNESELRERAAMADLAALNRRLETVSSSLSSTEAALAAKSDECAAALASHREADEQLRSEREVVGRLTAELNEQRESLEASEADAESSKQAVAELRIQLEEAQSQAAQNAARWESEHERVKAALASSEALSKELDALRASSSAAQAEADAQLAGLRDELAAAGRAHSSALKALREDLEAQQHAAQQAADAHREQLAAVRNELRDAQDLALAEQRTTLTATLTAAHELELATLRSTAEATSARFEEELTAARAARDAAALTHAGALKMIGEENARQLEERQRAVDDAIREKAAALEQASAEKAAALAQAHAEKADALAQAHAEKADALEQAHAESERALGVLAAKHAESTADAAARHEAALAELGEQHSASMAALRAQQEAALAELEARHEQALAEQAERHEQVLADNAEHHEQQSAALQLALNEELTLARTEREKERASLVAAAGALRHANDRGAALQAAAEDAERRSGLVIAALLRDVQAVAESEASLRDRVATSERALTSLLESVRVAMDALPSEPVIPAAREAGDALITWQSESAPIRWTPIDAKAMETTAVQPTVDTAEVDLQEAAVDSNNASSSDPRVTPGEDSWVVPTEVDGTPIGVAEDGGDALELEGLGVSEDSDLGLEVSFDDSGVPSLEAGTAETQQINDPDMLSALQDAHFAPRPPSSGMASLELVDGAQPEPAPQRKKQQTTVEVGVNAHAAFDEPDFVIQRQPSFELGDDDERVPLGDSGVPLPYVEASGRGDTEASVSLGSITSMGAPGDALAEARARGEAFDRQPTRNDVELVDVEDRYVVQEISDLASMDDAMVDLHEDEIDEDDFV